MTPLDNGDILVTQIQGAWISRITRAGTVLWSVQAPRVRYPSDAFPTADGQVIVADDLRERVVVIDRKTKDLIWQYGVTDRKGYAPGYLNYPDGSDLDVFYDWKGALDNRR